MGIEDEIKSTIETQKEKEQNPNSIGELISIGKDLATNPDRVYRSVKGRAAIDDIESSGVVRNKQSAGLVEKSRWGERVFWSKGAEGKFHPVQKDGFVIEAPLKVAQERVVRRDDITAIYSKDETGKVFDLLEEKRLEQEHTQAAKRDADESKIRDIRKSLGLES